MIEIIDNPHTSGNVLASIADSAEFGIFIYKSKEDGKVFIQHVRCSPATAAKLCITYLQSTVLDIQVTPTDPLKINKFNLN